jgi:hypothetical protein
MAPNNPTLKKAPKTSPGAPLTGEDVVTVGVDAGVGGGDETPSSLVPVPGKSAQPPEV